MAKETGGLRIRLAGIGDLPAIDRLQQAAISRLQRGFLSEAQIEASRAAMGLDTSLVEDGTYFCVEDVMTGELAGCGGWSRRATLYGGDHSADRSARRLDPVTEPARIRAMYTHPDHVRRGVGRLILARSEAAAAAEGFRRLTLAATEAGKSFYLACGYHVEAAFEDTGGGIPVPLYRMEKVLTDKR